MNSRKAKNTENNENLCPGKRIKISTPKLSFISNIKNSPYTSLKLGKHESESSPSALTNEYLEEMGIGMLDSEESSSSAASALALALSTSADENSNEATPNLDAPKLYHQHLMAAYRSIDHTLDTSTDDANISFIDPNETLKAIANVGTTTANVHRYNINNNNSNSNNSFDIYTDEMQQLQEQLQQTRPRKSNDKLHKKVAILGAGAGMMSTSGTNSNSNSPSTGRSPLATVACNSHHRNASQQQQAAVNISNINNNNNASSNSSSSNNQISITPHAVLGGTTSLNSNQRSQSPSLMPSTSQQAALLKQQQQLQLLRKQKQIQQQQQTRFIPNENFFLFRNPNACDMLQNSDNSNGNEKSCFDLLSDEMVLQIFQWLPKKTLLRCGLVSRRFNCCARDDSLWTRLDLGGRSLRSCALENILTRGVVVLRLAQSELNHPIFDEQFLTTHANFESRLQYLDLSMVSITKPSLKMLLSRCRQLKKLSLEHVTVNDEICNEIAKNTNIEALNLAMVVGLEAWSIRKIMESLKNLNSLNVSWTSLSVDAVTSLVANVSPNLMRLNIAGCRKTMFDSHLSTLAKRCTQLLELDLSDCTGLTANAISIISSKFKMLEYLSLSRCYQIPASSYGELRFLRPLAYLDVFGMVTDTALEALERNLPKLGINKFIHSSVARPTVGTRRTSIWGLRTRD